MRYRRLSYRYAEVVSAGATPVPDLWNLRVPARIAEGRWRPPADLYETPSAFIVKAEVPGMADDDFDITLYADGLVIEGVRPWEHFDGETHFHAVGIRYGPFRLEVPLRATIDRDRVVARYECGFLYVTLPKAEVHAP